jgi:hypothetical protein
MQSLAKCMHASPSHGGSLPLTVEVEQCFAGIATWCRGWARKALPRGRFGFGGGEGSAQPRSAGVLKVGETERPAYLTRRPGKAASQSSQKGSLTELATSRVSILIFGVTLSVSWVNLSRRILFGEVAKYSRPAKWIAEGLDCRSVCGVSCRPGSA